jgi:hypothetical protein
MPFVTVTPAVQRRGSESKMRWFEHVSAAIMQLAAACRGFVGPLPTLPREQACLDTLLPHLSVPHPASELIAPALACE